MPIVSIKEDGNVVFEKEVQGLDSELYLEFLLKVL